MQDPKYSDLIEFFGTVTHSGLSLYQALVQTSGMPKVSDGLFWKGSVDEILRQAMSGGRDWHVFLQALETMEGQAWGLVAWVELICSAVQRKWECTMIFLLYNPQTSVASTVNKALFFCPKPTCVRVRP